MNDRGMILRNRQAETDDELDRVEDAEGLGTRAGCAETFNDGDYPDEPNRYYACHPATVGGEEVENGEGTWTVDTDATIYCYNTGTEVPPAGTKLVYDETGDGRKVFEWDGE